MNYCIGMGREVDVKNPYDLKSVQHSCKYLRHPINPIVAQGRLKLRRGL